MTKASDENEHKNLSRLESLVFVSKDSISIKNLSKILSLEMSHTRELMKKLVEKFSDSGILLEEISGGFSFRSNPVNAHVLRQAFKLKPAKISKPALETLAITAYKQPLTRSEVEEIRGVDSGGVLKYLFQHNLVKILGRKEAPGRPLIYGTTKKFLSLFGLKTLSDLPALHEFSELWDEHQNFVDEAITSKDSNESKDDKIQNITGNEAGNEE